LLYALYAGKSVNSGDISLKELFDAAGDVFNLKITNFSRIFTAIKARKGDRTVFLDDVKIALILYMESFDRK
jgi:hypothetical protein